MFHELIYHSMFDDIFSVSFVRGVNRNTPLFNCRSGSVVCACESHFHSSTAPTSQMAYDTLVSAEQDGRLNFGERQLNGNSITVDGQG